MMKNKCWVVKIGSALLTNNGKGIDKQLIARWEIGRASCRERV